MVLHTSDTIVQGLSLFYLLAFLILAISYLFWKHQANQNAAAMSGKSLEYSPGWSVGYYFIPIVNLFRPDQAMKEIVEKSVSTADEVPYGLLGGWWFFWIVNGILGRISWRLPVETLDELHYSDMFALMTGIGVGMPGTLVFFLLVRGVYAMQRPAQTPAG